MGKRLILILALALVVGLTMTAYAEVQNVKVSGDITVTGLGRNNIMLRRGNAAPTTNTNTTYNEYDYRITGVLSQARVRVDADLTDNVSTTVRLINERMWGVEGMHSTNNDGTENDRTLNTAVAIDLAYATMKEFLYSPLSLSIGRQELHFGNDLIIGDVDTNMIMAGHGTAATNQGEILPRSLDDLSLRKSFDAIRATLNYDPLVVDVVWSLIDDPRVDRNSNVDLFGGNASYALDKNTTVEAYYWEKLRHKAAPSSTDGTLAKNDSVKTIGGRVQYNGVKNLALGVEGAYQFGRQVKSTTLYPDDLDNSGTARKRNAFALQLVGSYKLADLVGRVSGRAKSMEPVIDASYTVLSGEKYKNVKSTYTGWDPMYENQAGGTLFNKILGYSNATLLKVGGAVKPLSDLKVAVDYYYIRLLKAYTAYEGNENPIVNITGVAGDPTYRMNVDKKNLGNEIDAIITYDYTEDVQLALNMGWFIPGNAFNKGSSDNGGVSKDLDGNRRTASQILGSMKVTF